MAWNTRNFFLHSSGNLFSPWSPRARCLQSYAPLEALLENPFLSLPASGGIRCCLAVTEWQQSLSLSSNGFLLFCLLSLLRALITGFKSYQVIQDDLISRFFCLERSFSQIIAHSWGLGNHHSVHYRVYAKFSQQALFLACVWQEADICH